MIPVLEALDRLRSGNARFVDEEGARRRVSRPALRRELVKGQEPFAVILGCADSRVPAEIVFDQDLGDLFVIRVAGNICDPALVGSVEFAAEILGTRLVVVLGHSSCGAVQATLDQIASPSSDLSPNLAAIVEAVRPAVEPVVAKGLESAALVHESVRANVRASVEELGRSSAILRRLAADDGLRIVGAEYSLESGEVDFFHHVPEGA